jgi:hypothetical protein
MRQKIRANLLNVSKKKIYNLFPDRFTTVFLAQQHCRAVYAMKHISRKNSRCLIAISSILWIEQRSSKYRTSIEEVSNK